MPAVKRATHTSGTSSLSHTMMTTPVASRPRRPARPDICVYSPGKSSRKPLPSCLRIPEKTTERAGMLTPWMKGGDQPLAVRDGEAVGRTDHGKSLGRKEHLDVALRKEDLDNLCDEGTIFSRPVSKQERYLLATHP